jgi:glycosyltransferase involved in cell wall biosynthesis
MAKTYGPASKAKPMKVVVALETRFQRTPDGKVWTQTMNAYPFWTRYLEVFDHVGVVARVLDVPAVSPGWQLASGAGVSFRGVPYYVGLLEYLRRARQVGRAARSAFSPGDAVILRVSSLVASYLQRRTRRISYPYGVEVVGDPYDVFSPGAFRHPLRPWLRWWFSRQLRQQCAQACAAAYVTKFALQKRYPCPNYAIGVSDVEISDAALASGPRNFSRGGHAFTLIWVGSLAHLYKAPDILIEAVGKCVQSGIDLRLVLVGDGIHRDELEAQAVALGIEERVRFLGQLPAGEAVRRQLDEADLFVLPSRQEGLPRAMVEAMARALPCLGSTVGGIPELLPSEEMVPPGDSTALAQKIGEVLRDPVRLGNMSRRNLEIARGYRDEILSDQRNAFFRQVKEKTDEWLNKLNN